MKDILFMLIINFGFISVFYAQNDSIFQKANDAYADDNYQEANRLYHTILNNEMSSGELYFNLANTYYKLEDLPNAIYYYEKALLQKPSDKAILNNLRYAERMRLDQFKAMPKSNLDQLTHKVIHFFTIDKWAITGIILLILAAITFGLYLWFHNPTSKRIFLLTSIAFIVISIGSFTIAQSQWDEKNKTAYAIIFSKEKNLLEEPNPKSNVLVELHEGTKIKILDQFRSFYKVELPDGSTGWMTTDSIKKI